jgi:hypothetical protein
VSWSVDAFNTNASGIAELVRQYLSDHLPHRYHSSIRYLSSVFSSFDVTLTCFYCCTNADNTTDDASETLITLKEALNVVIMPTASALFFIRLRAVYSRNNYMTAFFGFWLLVILAFFLFDSARVAMHRSEIAQSERYWTAHYIDAWGYIATAAYDTLMYLSISWQLASFAVVDRWQDRLRLFVTGNGLGWLSKVLLQSGQMYYLWVSNHLSLRCVKIS